MNQTEVGISIPEYNRTGLLHRNKTKEYQMTVIVPVFNEVDNMQALEERLSGFLASSLLKACVLFVDDGSTDESLKYIAEICCRHPHFFYIHFVRNAGLSAALKAGFDQVQSRYVGYIDADLQTDPEDFNLLALHLNNYEMVMGFRAEREDSLVKKASSLIANSFRRFITKDGIYDTGCPLKIIRTDYARRIPMFEGMHRFLPAMVQLQGGKVQQIPVCHFPRVAGKSKFNLANRLISPLIDCFAFRWMKSRYLDFSISEVSFE